MQLYASKTFQVSGMPGFTEHMGVALWVQNTHNSHVRLLRLGDVLLHKLTTGFVEIPCAIVGITFVVNNWHVIFYKDVFNPNEGFEASRIGKVTVSTVMGYTSWVSHSLVCGCD